MSDVWRVRLRIGANGSEYENAGIIAEDPYAAVAEAIGEIGPSVRVIQVARDVIDEGWLVVYSAESGSAEAEGVTVFTIPRVITRADRELIDPFLGDDFMVGLMARDREAWAQAGTLITRAFSVGKEAAAGADQVTIPRGDLSVLLAAAAVVAGEQPVPELLAPLVADVAERYKVHLEVT